MSNVIVDALTGLVESDFPVAARARYADDAVLRLAGTRVRSANPAMTVQSDPTSQGTSIYAKKGSPAVAVNDGKIVRVGVSAQLGRYVILQDVTGNTYTYANLGSIPALYPVPKPVKLSASEVARVLVAPAAPKPTGPATAGSQLTEASSITKATEAARSAPASWPVTRPAASRHRTTIAIPMVKERLFAYPSRPASYAAGGKPQLHRSAPQPQRRGPQLQSVHNYFSDVLHLAKNQYTLKPLKAGSVVVAGTILGRLGPSTPTDASHLQFMIQPAGKHAPHIDPGPILGGWKLLAATKAYRATGLDPFFGRGKNPTVGQILLMSKEQLQNRVLRDPGVQIYACGRRDIEAGSIDRRVLAVIEFLSASGLDPSISGLKCGSTQSGSNGVDGAGATGATVDISAINGIPIKGHQGRGSITDVTIRRLLTLQGAMQPDEIVSLMSYKGQPTALSLPDHNNRIQVSYTPLYGQNNKASAAFDSITSGQWTQLMDRLGRIPEPSVPISPSKYAIKTSGS
jgi:hypothetical protein